MIWAPCRAMLGRCAYRPIKGEALPLRDTGLFDPQWPNLRAVA